VDSQSSDLVATVLGPGPAYEAGIRNGDRLLRVNERDVSGWRTDPNPMESPSSWKPAGTKVDLTVQREGQILDVTIVLKELLPVETLPASGPEE
jgi:S1-C subfamily serine protease